MHRCTERELRKYMSDDDFWLHVALSIAGRLNEHEGPGPADGDDEYDPRYEEPYSTIDTACGHCGALGACGYDMEGRPMMHVRDPNEQDMEDN